MGFEWNLCSVLYEARVLVGLVGCVCLGGRGCAWWVGRLRLSRNMMVRLIVISLFIRGVGIKRWFVGVASIFIYVLGWVLIC